MGAKVLSTSTLTFFSWAMEDLDGMSATARVRFDWTQNIKPLKIVLWHFSHHQACVYKPKLMKPHRP